MESIALITNTESIKMSEVQTITGIIFYDFGSYKFPEKDWNDLIVIVLSWWLAALKNIVIDRSLIEELRFMEGPLYIKAINLGNDRCKIECVDERSGGNTVFSEVYSITKVISTILGVAKSIESVCSENGWDNDDIRELKAGIKDINELFQS